MRQVAAGGFIFIALVLWGCGEAKTTPKQEAAELHHDCQYLQEQGVGDSYCEEEAAEEFNGGIEAAENEGPSGRVSELEKKTEESDARVEREIEEHQREREELGP